MLQSPDPHSVHNSTKHSRTSSPFFPTPYPAPQKYSILILCQNSFTRLPTPHLRPHPCSNCPLTPNSKILSRNSKNFLETPNSLHETRIILTRNSKILILNSKNATENSKSYSKLKIPYLKLQKSYSKLEKMLLKARKPYSTFEIVTQNLILEEQNSSMT